VTTKKTTLSTTTTNTTTTTKNKYMTSLPVPHLQGEQKKKQQINQQQMDLQMN
jgi:hypothetical protein